MAPMPLCACTGRQQGILLQGIFSTGRVTVGFTGQYTSLKCSGLALEMLKLVENLVVGTACKCSCV